MIAIGCSGHQFLPTEAALVAAAAIDELLAGLNGDVTGICSLADGTDQIFAARVLERGFRLQAILPCHEYEDTFVEEDSRASFLELLAMADHCETLVNSVKQERKKMSQ